MSSSKMQELNIAFNEISVLVEDLGEASAVIQSNPDFFQYYSK